MPRTHETVEAGTSPGECGQREKWLKTLTENTSHSTKARDSVVQGAGGPVGNGQGRQAVLQSLQGDQLTWFAWDQWVSWAPDLQF